MYSTYAVFKEPPPPPLAQGLKLPLNTLANTIMASNSTSMIKQLLKLNWLSQNVVFVRTCKCLAYHYGNNNYVQPLVDMKNYSVFLAQIIFYLHDDLSMLFLPCGGWWKGCAELRSSTHIPTLQCLSVSG